MIIFQGGMRQKWNFQRGGGPFYQPILENPEGMGVKGKIPSVGGMDIFWNYTFSSNQHFNYFLCEIIIFEIMLCIVLHFAVFQEQSATFCINFVR